MRALSVIVGLAITVYVALAAYVKFNETSLVYHPGERTIQTPDAALGISPRVVRFASSDETPLVGWLVHATGPDSAAGVWVLDCHGNAGNISSYGRPRWAAWMREQGLNVFQFDYRGFGESGGSPSEQGLYRDAEAAYRFLLDSLGVPPERIVIYGHSLGSGVATHLASRVPAAGLIVEGAFTAVADRGQELYPWLPVRLLSSNDFDSVRARPASLRDGRGTQGVPHGDRRARERVRNRARALLHGHSGLRRYGDRALRAAVRAQLLRRPADIAQAAARFLVARIAPHGFTVRGLGCGGVAAHQIDVPAKHGHA
jgi:uncharacterized protein